MAMARGALKYHGCSNTGHISSHSYISSEKEMNGKDRMSIKIKEVLRSLFDITTIPKFIYSKPAPQTPLLCLPAVGTDGDGRCFSQRNKRTFEMLNQVQHDIFFVF
jgi:hypothetical protein